jgi:lysine 2,3-aminomutase
MQKKSNRQIALERAAKARAMIKDFLEARNKIECGLKLKKQFEKNKKKIMDLLGASKADWESYEWQIKNRITSVDLLSEIINLNEKEKQDIEEVKKTYRWAVSPYYASLMHPRNKKCPVRMQAIPSIAEIKDKSEIKDPMIKKFNSPAPTISRIYPDRLIINVTNRCAMLCRHCMRRKDISTRDVYYSKKDVEEGIAYIRESKEIRDVLITGGDALSLSDSRLDEILGELSEIPHVEIVRLGSRMPCTLPQRITPELCEVLEKYDNLYLNTQFNHPKEVTIEAKKAALMLTKAGVPLGDQTVLLKGINDDVHVMKKLMHELLKIKIKPYYIFHCKKVEGIKHFRSTVSQGLNIIENLRGYTSGMAVPTFIITAPNALGKTPIYPNYVLSTNFKGKMLIRTWSQQCALYEY